MMGTIKVSAAAYLSRGPKGEAISLCFPVCEFLRLKLFSCAFKARTSELGSSHSDHPDSFPPPSCTFRKPCDYRSVD